MSEEDLLELRSCFKVAYHVPGRIRLRFDDRLMAHPGVTGADDLRRLLPGVSSVRVFRFARSVVADYAPEQTHPGMIDRFFRCCDDSEARSILRKLSGRRTGS